MVTNGGFVAPVFAAHTSLCILCADGTCIVCGCRGDGDDREARGQGIEGGRQGSRTGAGPAHAAAGGRRGIARPLPHRCPAGQPGAPSSAPLSQKLVRSLKKGNKVSIVDKTKADWEKWKAQQGQHIQEELETYKKSGTKVRRYNLFI